MADRDILPSDFKPSHYDLTIKDLNFNDWSYKGLVASVLMAGNLASSPRPSLSSPYQLNCG